MRELAATDENRRLVLTPRDDFVQEIVGDTPDRFVQADGPFTSYERTVESSEIGLRETTSYRLSIPWFGWLFALPVRRTLKNHNDQSASGWVGETQARTDTTTPTLGKLVITVNEQYAQPKATQKMIDDSAIDIEG